MHGHWAFLVFLASIVPAYAIMHGYAFRKLRQALRPRGAATAALFASLAVLSVLPFAAHLLDRADHERLAAAVGLPGYLWLAAVFWFCSLALAADAWNGLLRLAGLGWPAARALRLEPRRAASAAAAVVAAALVFSMIEARRIRVREIDVPAPVVSRAERPIRIAQISDVHLSTDHGDRLVRELVSRLREINPDVLVSTGDLIDEPLSAIRRLADELATLRPPLGKYAVLGNHEYYTGMYDSIAFLEAAGFRILRQANAEVGGWLRLAGVDDPAGRYVGPVGLDDERVALGAPAAGRFVVLLKHQPTVRPDSARRFDLQLSGHTHGGQLFPFHGVVRLLYPWLCGWHPLAEGGALFISRGVGTWGPPMRLFAPPEILVFRVTPSGP